LDVSKKKLLINVTGGSICYFNLRELVIAIELLFWMLMIYTIFTQTFVTFFWVNFAPSHFFCRLLIGV